MTAPLHPAGRVDEMRVWAEPDEPNDFDPGPHVCPGCYAVGEEPCLPGCVDARTVFVALVAALETGPKSSLELAKAMGQSRHAADQMCSKLTATGEIRRVGRGRYALPERLPLLIGPVELSDYAAWLAPYVLAAQAEREEHARPAVKVPRAAKRSRKGPGTKGRP